MKILESWANPRKGLPFVDLADFPDLPKDEEKATNVKKASREETIGVDRYVIKWSKLIKWNIESKPKTLHKWIKDYDSESIYGTLEVENNKKKEREFGTFMTDMRSGIKLSRTSLSDLINMGNPKEVLKEEL
jgi:hypothetical protein